MPPVSKDNEHLAGQPRAMPIAICGMGMRLPGGIRDSDALYDFLLNKRDAGGPVPPDRFNFDGFYSAQGKPGSLSIRQGYWLDDIDLSHFDSSLFSMRRAEIENLDPQQRLLLEVVREAFEDAAETDWRGKNIACYAATYGEDWSNLHAKDVQNRGFSVYSGYMDLMQANRISYEYDLRGPSMTLRVGCSGVGLGIHLACQSIQLGECSSAIVAGASIILSPDTTVLMADGGALSPDGSCKTFDASANGYVRAEGINCLYIKRLDEAIRDGNPVRAVIRSTSTNAGGKTSGITVPSMDAQEALIRAAYRNGVLEDAALTAMVECRGTGTAMGDATEAGAVARIFGEKGVHIGSVKPNLGHSEEPAAGTSIIKAVVELENRILLPNIKFEIPNPAIPWDEANLRVPTEPTEWPEDRLERISVNSYGIGGTNVHVVLDSAASFGLTGPMSDPAQPDFKLLLLSAGHPDSLKQMQHNYQEYAAKHPGRLTDLAYTLSHRRERLPVRGFCITKGGDDDDVFFSPPFTSESPKVAFVFTGQGAQWPQMGKELLETYPDMLGDIREMDNILRRLDKPPAWRLEEELLKPAGSSLLAHAGIAQPVSTAFQIALCNLVSRWNVLPVATIGHSSGEIAAAYAAGSLGMRDAILLAYYRGAASTAQKRAGAMAAVGLGYDEVTKWLVPGVVIACGNSPASVTLSGDADAVKAVLSNLAKEYPDGFQRLLKVNMAYHSHHMQQVGQLYDRLIANQLKTRSPKVPFYSTVTTERLHNAEDFGPHYWRRNMESPVWFNQGFTSLLESEIGRDAIYLEIGPHSALAGPIKQIYRAQNASNPYKSVLNRGSNGLVSFLSCMGELSSRGVKINYPLPSTKPKALHSLPLYPWHHTEGWWSESRPMKNSRFQRFPPHDLLGVRTIESSDVEPAWRNVLRVGHVSWLRDHCVGPDIVFPAAGYIAMAGHAIWQITGLEDYTVREVSFQSAMVLDEMLPTEIITRLQPQRLTSSLNSKFFNFSIHSHGGSVWVQHCSGLVAAGQTCRGPKPTVASYSRVVDPKRWYRAMNDAGLRYGPRFKGLAEVTASVSNNAASTVVQDYIDPQSSYTLHPTTIDFILQSSLVATHRGQPRFMQQARLPTFINELYVKGGAAGQDIHINTTTKQRSSDACGVFGKDLVFLLKGLEFTALDMQEDEQEEQYETAQLVWKPHLELADPTTLVKPAHGDELSSANPVMERIFLLCILDAVDEIKHITPVHAHLETYRTWMYGQLARARNEGCPLIPDVKALVTLGAGDRKSLIKSLVADHTEGTMVPGSRILFRCYEHLSDIFKGKTDPLDLMRQDGLLGRFYDCLQDKHDYGSFLQLLGHLRPNMNVLEIGAGTGGLTAKILDFLQTTEPGEQLYREYTYTDISSGFFVGAKERFHSHTRIRYEVLDISKDPVEQGFPVGHYDLIIASNILHATPYLTETLKHTKTLLKPDGRLLLQELCPVANWVNFVFGLFQGWWLGKDDGRAEEPYISPAAWDARLRDAGFSGIDASALDAEYPYQLNTMLVAKPAPREFHPKRVTLLCTRPFHTAVNILYQYLGSDGCGVDLIGWGEDLPADQDVVSLLDLQGPFFDGITKENLAAFLRVVEAHAASNFLWVTGSAQIKPQDPRFAQVLGMARTLRSELGVSFTTLGMQHFGPGSEEAICLLLRTIQRRAAESTGASEFEPDYEFAWDNGAIHVGRMHWLSVPEALTHAHGDEVASTTTLEIARAGLLSTLRWASKPAEPLLPHQVRIKVMSVGMNFREVLVAMGMVPNIEDQEGFGTDSAGIVSAIGSNVTNLAAGDRVMAFTVENSSCATEVTISSQHCARIPDDCGFADASTLPTVYLTVLRALREKANLGRGQSVLIHSAAGGVGIAAIHYAKSVGAKIYATVGAPEKTAFLVEKLGLTRENIFYSRDNSFQDAVSRATNGRGVDVVLNSLSGEQLHASWQCVAQGGSMVEIGKRDLLGRGQLAMNPFLANRSYIGVDIVTLALAEPDWVQQQMATIVDLYNQGVIRPIHPITTFPADKVQDAFRYLQTGQHTGKVVVQFRSSPESSPHLPVATKKAELKLRADRAYLLVGGMRGIGTSIARWMVSHGAKTLVYLSRSAGEKDEDRILVHELSDMGCQALTFAGDVADLETVRRVVSSVAVPIAGVFQLAMVLSDTGVMDMDFEKWNAAVRPKVNGTWNLHEALPKDMDFFVMASSLSGIFGNYGQSNYASANTFLDAFAQFRLSRGLAASAVDLGVVDEIGWVSRSASVHRQVVQQMSVAVSEESMLNCFHLAIVRSRPSNESPGPSEPLEGFRAPNQLLHGILSKAGVAKGQYMWRRDIRTASSRVHQQNGESTRNGGDENDGGLGELLSAVQDAPEILRDESSAQVTAMAISHQVSLYTMRAGDQDIDLALSLKDLGVDSLVSIELRNWWKQVFGADVTVLQLMNGGNLLGLGQKAVEQLKQKYLKV